MSRVKIYGVGLREEKFCKGCQQTLSLSAFSVCTYITQGYQKTNAFSDLCKKCTSKRAAERAKEYHSLGLCWCGRKRLVGLSRCKDCRENGRKSRERCRERRSTNAKERRARYRARVFSAYENQCACCGQKTPEFLEIDHIGGWGTKHRDRQGRRVSGMALYLFLIREDFPKGFRLLCGNCHSAISYCGYCPHQREKEKEQNVSATSIS